MGFPNPFAGKGDDKKKDGEPASVSDSKGASKATEAVSTANSSTAAAAQEMVLPDPARATSVFEFGPAAQAGQVYMRGVCIGEDPDAIQACTWSIEPVQQGKGKETNHLYRIEF